MHPTIRLPRLLPALLAGLLLAPGPMAAQPATEAMLQVLVRPQG